MTSNGGLAAPDFFRGKDAILSGPAGGVVGMAETRARGRFSRVIGFDMGGTSTDVSRFDGTYERVYETEVAGVRLRAPMMAIHTVAAGGGSILHYDGARLRVGPDSAGADPGPACYRRGGPLALTDANVMIGKLSGEFFPRSSGRMATHRWTRMWCARNSRRWPKRSATGARGKKWPTASSASRSRTWPMRSSGFRWRKGYDTREYALNCFGGAGGQHACLVADALGMTRIFIHPFSGVLSAYGMRLAALRSLRQQAVIGRSWTMRCDGAADARLAHELGARRRRRSRPRAAWPAHARATVHLRYAGSDTTLPVALGTLGEMAAAFARAACAAVRVRLRRQER